MLMLYKNTKAIVRSIEGDTDVFDIVNSAVQGNIYHFHL